jgi:peroxiredoxin
MAPASASVGGSQMSDTIESLNAQFEALHAERLRTWDPEKLAKNVEQRRELVAAFDPAKVVQAGDRLAPFILTDDEGLPLTLDELVAHGPAVLIFFRFAGCPACNLALPYYDRHLWPALHAAGISLVAISPHLPEQGLSAIRTRHGLRFPVASDKDNALGRSLGITFARDQVPAGHPTPGWIGELTGTATAELPQPTVILVDTDRVVRFVSISPDWLIRTEAPEILAAIDSLKVRQAA